MAAHQHLLRLCLAVYRYTRVAAAAAGTGSALLALLVRLKVL